MNHPINLTIQPTRAEHIREGHRIRMGARTVTVASIRRTSDLDNDYLVVHFEENAPPRTFNLDQHGGTLVDVVIADVYESDDISYLLTQSTGPATPYSRGYAAGRQATADDIGQATDKAITRYRQTHMPTDGLIADILERAERIALRKETP